MRKLLMLLAVICLNGCAILMVDTNLAKMRGHNIRYAVHVLGRPYSFGRKGDGAVFYWKRSGLYTDTRPRVANSYVNGDTSYSVQTHYRETYTTQGSCIIEIKTDDHLIITDTDITGYPTEACYYYAFKLQDAMGK